MNPGVTLRSAVQAVLFPAHAGMNRTHPREEIRMTTFADIKAAVAEISTVRASVVVLIERMIEHIRDVATAPTQDEMNSLLTTLGLERAALADAVAAGTAAAGESAPRSLLEAASVEPTPSPAEVAAIDPVEDAAVVASVV
jgi:hypothetical protein